MSTVYSVPATFSIDAFLGPNTQDVIFAIPAGPWVSGIWTVQGTVTNAPTVGDPATANTATNTHDASFGNLTNGLVNQSVACTAQQIADINAAQNTNLAADFYFAGVIGQIAVSSFSLSLSGCSYTINPAVASIGCSGGSGSTSVTTSGSCAWAATPLVSWLHSSSSGTGNGTVNYTVDANPGPARVGQITIATQTLTVTQAGCGSSAVFDSDGNPVSGYRHDSQNYVDNQFGSIVYAKGYARANLLGLFGALSGGEYWACAPRGNVIAQVVNDTLYVYDSSMTELATGVSCPSVDVWRIRY